MTARDQAIVPVQCGKAKILFLPVARMVGDDIYLEFYLELVMTRGTGRGLVGVGSDAWICRAGD